MSHVPNFSRIAEVMQQAQAFYADASRCCDTRSLGDVEERERLTLLYASNAAKALADTLGSSLHRSRSAAHQAYMQYTSERAAPGAECLRALQAEGSGSRVIELLQQATQRWSDIFAELESRAPTPEASALHVGCRQLLDTFAKELSKGHAQASDL